MKLLLVMGNDDTFNSVSLHAKALGFELIRYNHIVKAMDNIDEIDPSALIISAKDFPRHWKVMTQFVRYERAKESFPIIILKGANFPTEETSKTSFLEIGGLITEPLDNPEEIENLRGILNSCTQSAEKPGGRLLHAEQLGKFGFVFNTPQDNILVTGTVKDISKDGLSFLPDNGSLMRTITLYKELKECSLRAGDSFFSPVCRLSGTDQIVSLEFISFPEGEREAFAGYLESVS
jgi:hypothetical protein